jgi:hypothetical protein
MASRQLRTLPAQTNVVKTGRKVVTGCAKSWTGLATPHLPPVRGTLLGLQWWVMLLKQGLGEHGVLDAGQGGDGSILEE